MIEQRTDITKIERPNLLEAYLNRMVDYLVRVKHADPDQARDFVMQTMRDQYRPTQATYVYSVTPGQVEIRTSDMRKYITMTRNKVVSPSGSIYMPTSQHPSPVSEFLNFKKKQRKQVKNEQLKNLAMGNVREANRLWYLQASIKIRMNALPGNYGSEYGIFYDKGGYNTITSCGRAQISRSSATVEMFLGGMLAFFSENDLVNYILVALKYMTDKQEIEGMMTRYSMKRITNEQLFAFFRSFCIKPGDYNDAKELIQTLDSTEVNYLFYHNNLHNIFQENTEVFKPIIQDILNPDNYPPIEGTVNDIYAFDDPTRTLVSVAFCERLERQSVETITKDHQHLIPVFIGLARGVTKRMLELRDLIATFCWTMDDIPNVKAKQQAPRNTVILQDTDSNLYTCVQWAEWYSGHEKFNVDDESLAIDAFISYLLHIHVEFVMWKFSKAIGCTSPHMKTIAMKGEFVFSVVILYEVKKVYANLTICREGQMLPKLTPDIKGQLLRGSSKSEMVNQMTEDFIVEKILVPATNGKISAVELIREIVGIETAIKNSLLAGETTYLNTKSVRRETDYKDPDSVSILVAWQFWEDLFGHRYGSIQRPTKCLAFPALKPTAEYVKAITEADSKLGEKLKTWMTAQKKFPTEIIVSTNLERIPEEIIPLIDIRKIVFQNCQAIYYTLRRLCIAAGDPKMQMLFADMYPDLIPQALPESAS